MAQSQRETFYVLLEEYIAKHDSKKQNSVCITKERYEKALACIQLDKGDKCSEGAQFKFWCSKNFSVHNIGSKKVLYCKKTSCPVVSKEDIFDTIQRCHERVGHSGRNKTWEEVTRNFAWIRYGIIQVFLKTCSSCAVRQTMKPPPTGKPIISLGFLTRVQVDLIDMSSRLD